MGAEPWEYDTNPLSGTLLYYSYEDRSICTSKTSVELLCNEVPLFGWYQVELSPDGREYLIYDQGINTITRYSLDGKVLGNLSTEGFHVWSINWATVGGIYFTADKDGKSQIWRWDGKNNGFIGLMLLESCDLDEYQQVTNSRVAYLSYCRPDPTFVIIDFQSNTQTEAISQPGYGKFASLHQFVYQKSDAGDMWVVSILDQQHKRLVQGPIWHGKFDVLDMQVSWISPTGIYWLNIEEGQANLVDVNKIIDTSQSTNNIAWLDTNHIVVGDEGNNTLTVIEIDN
uniref:WD40 repeat domain-containing protein n=1 Tax=candidate division WWE3 bacterium TaxID=2053526 RepID=A0A7C4TIW1_UNCKA